LLYVLDVSGSADFYFVGTSIGDVNNDGLEDTRLDAEIAAFIALNDQLITQGLEDRARVAIVVYSGFAANADMNLVTDGFQLSTTLGADNNNNGINDIEEILLSITSGAFGVGNNTGTNPEAALQRVEDTFSSLGTEGSNGNLIFLTDGESNRGGSISDEVNRLRGAGFNLSAFGVGDDASLDDIQTIDPDGIRFSSIDEILEAFGGIDDNSQSIFEPLLSGVTVYLDLNNNGTLDNNEPFRITAEDDPNTPNIDETGQYEFNNLIADTYIVREVVPEGFEQTFPVDPDFHAIELEAGEVVENINFGNAKVDTGTIKGSKWEDIDGDGERDELESGLGGVTVYLDSNDNGILDINEPFQVTAEDDPNTPDIDETGQYEFNNLPAGTYIVREVVPNGYVQTAPIGTVLGSIFDGEFDDEDWSRTSLIRSGSGTIVETSKQILAGGNPDTYREMTHEWVGINVIIYHRYEGFTYDPAVEGAFDTIEYAEDERVPQIRGTLGGGMAIYQDGKIFRTFERGFNNFGWQTYAEDNLTEEDFKDETFWISGIPGENPDFSESGSPMQFGFWRSNFIPNFQVVIHAIDNWSVTLRDSNTDSYKVKLTAGEVVENIDFGNALASSVNIPPRIVSNPIDTAFTGVPYQYNVAAIDPNGDNLTYTFLTAPDGMEIDAQGVITWDTGAIGAYDVEVQVDDGNGGIVSQSYQLAVTELPVDEESPEVAFGFSGTLVNTGETINLQISGQDNLGLANLEITANGQSLPLNSNNIEQGAIYTASFTPDQPGIYEVVATATDFGGNTDSETITVRVFDPNDTTAPTAELDLSGFDPLNLVIREKTDISGVIEDENLEFYRVEIAPVSLINLSNPGEKDPDYITIAEGTGNINGVLATIDPALYRNDNYFVRIYAQDINGTATVEGFGVGLESQTKPGEFSLEYTDLNIPVAGIPIEITRSYSSLDSSFQGDFGYGWSLGLQDAQITEAAPDGRNLNFDDFFGGNSLTIGTRVTLTTPEGRRVGFTFDPQLDGGGFFGARYAPVFRPDPGVEETLEVAYTPLSIFGDGSVGLYLFGFTYNPSDYTLTTKNGTEYNYNQYNGLQTVEDRNGNTLTFEDDGITSSTGVEVDFIRDSQGRITQIVDPEGNSLIYTYDENGDLVGFGDRTNNETTFEYQAQRDHYLTKIIDPLNRTSVRTEYDENGQISKLFDADGNALDIDYDSATSRQTVKDPLGNTTTLVFDGRGNVVGVVDALNGITQRTYDENNNLLSETDPEGHTKSYTYDSRGNKLSETDGEGNTKGYTYNSRNDILTETDALGNITNYTYDANGNLTRRQDAIGNVTTYTYGQYGLLTEVTDANSKKSNFSYDRYGNITALVDPTGANTTFTYDRNGRVSSLTDALGAITNYVYDAQGRLIEKADPEGSSCGCARGIVKTEYNAAGEKIAEIDALGRRTEYRYSDRGLLIETILPDETPADLTDNPRTKNEYDALDRLIVTVDELGRKTHYIYDKLGRQIEVIYPDATPNDLTDNPRTKKEYDKAGLVIAEIDELGNRTELDYDKADRMIAQTNALNEVTSYTYDADGRQIAMTDGLGRTTNYAYDGLDRLISTTYANNAVMLTTYDPLGRIVAETDFAGNTTNYEYDALGRLTAVVDALNQRTEYKYDAVGNLIEQKDANNHVTKFEYDSLRRRKAMILPGGQRNETIHNTIGNLIRTTDFNGVTTTYEYNARNWLTEKSFSDGTPTENFTYTLTGELASVTDNRGVTNYGYDERDRLLSRTEPDNRQIQYTYDAAGNILSLIVPSGTTAYTYDQLNRIDTVIDPDSGITDYTYDKVGNLIKTEFPNGISENQQYDLLNRLTYLENREQTGIISSYTYTLDAMGNRTKVVENDGRTVEYIYDDLYRLTQEKLADAVVGNKVIDYKFDPVGNRLERIDSVEGKTTYSYDANDRLLEEVLGGKVTDYQYDAKGNLTAKVENGATQAEYEWNAKGELVAVEVTENGTTERIEFEYDHQGVRVVIKQNGEETRFLIDTNQQEYAQVIEEYQADGTVQNTYVHGIDLISQEDANGRIYYQVDGLGSTRLMTDNNGAIVVEYDYDAYGNLTRKVGNADNSYLFAGEQFDEAVDGYYLRARYYDPAIGRFVSRDYFMGFEENPESLHKYNYAENDPINRIDPTGFVSFAEYQKTLIPVIQKKLQECLVSIGLDIAVDFAASSVGMGVYIFLEGDKWYAGQSVNLQRRAREHAKRIYEQSFYRFSLNKKVDKNQLRQIEQYLYDIADSVFKDQTSNKIKPLSPKKPKLGCPV
jgi:RHS repeat-associated protein